MKARTSSLNNACIDASLWARWLTPEEGTEEIHKLFGLWLEEFNFFIAPSILIFEFTSVLRKKFKYGLIPQEVVSKGLKTFYEMPLILYQNEALLAETFEWAQRLGQTVIYDVSYLALAAAHRVPFFTGDRKFYEIAKSHYADVQFV